MKLTAAEVEALRCRFGSTVSSGDLWEFNRDLFRRASKGGGLQKVRRGVWAIPSPEVESGSEAARIEERFEVLEMMAKGLVEGNIRSMVCSGAGGVGKTYALETILNKAKADRLIDSVEFVRGTISAIGLYLKLFENAERGQVLVLDDIDSVYGDEEAMNLLKTALDTSERRYISWVKDSNFLRDREIPDSFEYRGQIVFLTNVDLDSVVAKGGKMAPHMAALLTRVSYLDLCIHTPQQILIRIEQVLAKTDMALKLKLKDSEVAEIIEFLSANVSRLRSISLRTVIQIAGYMKTTVDWQKLARATLIKGL